MTPTHSPALKVAIANPLATAFDTNGRIDIYTGSKPATANLAPTGTLLGTLTLAADAAGSPNASTGVVTFNAVGSDTSADASGTIGWARVKLAGDLGTTNNTDVRLDLVASATGGGGDIQFDNLSVTAGGTIAVTAFTYTPPS